MKSMFVLVLFSFLSFSAKGQDLNYRGFNSYSVTCESEQNRPKYCRLRATTIGVLEKKQLSGADCKKGESWGYSSQYIWVNQGCAASFTVFEDLPQDSYKHVLCESVDYQVGRCSTRETIDPDSLFLVVQTSGSPCIMNQTWSYDFDQWQGYDYIWTSDGCSGVFTYIPGESVAPERPEVPTLPTEPGIGGEDVEPRPPFDDE